MRRLLVILLCSSLFCLTSEAQNVKSKQDQKARIEKEIKFIDKQLKGLSSQQKATTKHLSLIQQKAADRKLLLKHLDGQMSELDGQIKDKKGEIQRHQRELDTLKAYYNKLIYNCYKNRDPKVWFMYVLASEDIGQGYRRVKYLKMLSDAVNVQGTKVKNAASRLDKEKSDLEVAHKEAATLKNARKKEYDKLLEEEKESKEIISKIAKDKKKYQAQLSKKRQEVNNLNRELQKIVKTAVKSSSSKKSSVNTALSNEFSKNKGRLGWPVESGIITEKFGVHSHPVYKNIQLPENNGITILTNKEAEVYCVFKGEVKQIIVMPGYSHCVLVQHGNYYTFYCRLHTVLVKAGQKLKTGDLLGTLEPEGKGSTLHFQIWEGTTKQNPESWLR